MLTAVLILLALCLLMQVLCFAVLTAIHVRSLWVRNVHRADMPQAGAAVDEGSEGERLRKKAVEQFNAGVAGILGYDGNQKRE